MRRYQERGFTLVEVLVALMIFALVSALMAPSFIYHQTVNSNQEIRTGAMAAAQRTLDDLRTETISGLPSSGSVGPTTISVDGKNFAVTTTYCGDPSLCDTNTRQLEVAVSFRNEVIYEVETVFTALR